MAPGSGANPPSLEDQQKAQQAEALQRMAQDPQTVRRLLANMTSQDDNLRLSATSQVRKLLSIGEFLAWHGNAYIFDTMLHFLQKSTLPFKMSLTLGWYPFSFNS